MPRRFGARRKRRRVVKYHVQHPNAGVSQPQEQPTEHLHGSSFWEVPGFHNAGSILLPGCICPGHSGRETDLGKKGCVCLPLSEDMARGIFEVFGVAVPVGSAICSSCSKDLYSKLKLKGHPVEPHDSSKGTLVTTAGFDDLSEGTSAAATRFGIPCPRSLAYPTGTSSSNSDPVDISMSDDRFVLQEKRRGLLNSLLEAHGYLPLSCTLNTNWDDISAEQQDYYIQKASEAIQAILTTIAPGQEDKLWDAVKNESFAMDEAFRVSSIKQEYHEDGVNEGRGTDCNEVNAVGSARDQSRERCYIKQEVNEDYNGANTVGSARDQNGERFYIKEEVNEEDMDDPLGVGYLVADNLFVPTEFKVECDDDSANNGNLVA